MRLVLLAAASALAAACASGGAKPDPAAAVPPGPDPVVVIRYEEALAALEAGDELQAEAKLQALADAYPDYSGPLVNLAVIRARRNEIEPATALLERAVAVCTRCAAPWNELGVMQRRQGRFADAEQSYLKSEAADPGFASAYFNLGVLYELYLQRPELALEQYARFRELEAADPVGGDVDKWIADLKRRTRTVERSAQAEEVQ
jgi:Flp pilus assembly protein TadD